MITPEEKEVVRSRGDVEGDGAVRMNDFVVLEQYYLYKNGIIPEDFNMYSYPDNNGDITMDSYRFTEDLKNTAIEKDLIYQFTADLIEKENISLDFNENGKADEYDLLEYQMYIYSKFSDPFNDDAAKALVPLTDSWRTATLYTASASSTAATRRLSSSTISTTTALMPQL